MTKKIHPAKSLLITLILAFLLFSSAPFVNAQMYGPKVTNINIDNSGLFIATEPEVGITYEITGIPGSSGSVCAQIYNGNPQVKAEIPNGITLAKFIFVDFNYNLENFMQAKLTFSYTDADIAGLQHPFALYKYVAETDSYVKMDGVVDTTAKTISITLNNIDDPLFAIGGISVAAATNESSSMIWIAVAVAVVFIVLVVFLLVKRQYSEDMPKKTGPGSWRPGI